MALHTVSHGFYVTQKSHKFISKAKTSDNQNRRLARLAKLQSISGVSRYVPVTP